MNVNFQNCRSGQGLQRAARDQAAYIKSLAKMTPEEVCPGGKNLEVFEAGVQIRAVFRSVPGWQPNDSPDFQGSLLVERPDGTGSACSMRSTASETTVEEYTRWADGTIEAFEYTNRGGKLKVEELPRLRAGQTTSLDSIQKMHSQTWSNFQLTVKPPVDLGIMML